VTWAKLGDAIDTWGRPAPDDEHLSGGNLRWEIQRSPWQVFPENGPTSSSSLVGCLVELINPLFVHCTSVEPHTSKQVNANLNNALPMILYALQYNAQLYCFK
jgi:hypothetical protein